MTEYTDAQYVGLAEWIGMTLTIDCGFYIVDGLGESWAYKSKKAAIKKIIKILNSHKGRCAIEDKMADGGTSFMKMYRTNDGGKEYFVFGPDNAEAIGYGPTPSAAWLDAGIKASEVEG